MEEERQILQMIFEFVLIIVGMGCATGIITSFIKRRGTKLQSPEIIARLDDITERLARLDTGVDAMSIEIERISEGQRFTTKLLSERTAPNK